MSKQKKLIEESDLESVIKQFPELDILVEDRLKVIHDITQKREEKYKIIQLKGIPESPEISLWFRDSLGLKFVINNTTGLRGIRLLPPKAALIIDDLFFAIIRYSSIPQERTINQDFSLQPGLVFEHFTMQYKEISLSVRMGGLKIRPDTAWKLIKSDSTKDNFLADAADNPRYKELDEAQLGLVWDATLYSLVLGFADSRPILPDLLGDSFMLYLPPLHEHSSNFLFIEPAESNSKDTFTPAIENSWPEIVDSALFSYYSFHGALPHIVEMKPGLPLQLEIQLWPDFLTHDPMMDEIQYRSIMPEILQYFSVAESSHLPSFRFLSFYHIIESFFEETNLESIAKEVKKILLSSDIANRTNLYANRIAELVMQYRVPYQSDDDRLRLVFESYIPFSVIHDILPDEITNILGKRVTFEGGLTLDLVNLNDESRFFSDLTRRVYLLRNAIVHSKRQSDRRRGRVTFSKEDQEKIQRECELIHFLALELVSRIGLVVSE